MSEQFNILSNGTSDVLYVVLSGISGGKDESLVRFLCEALKDRGSVLSMQFANDPFYHNDALPEMEEMSFNDCFERLDRALQIAGGEKAYTDIIFITHSFSSVITTYYLGIHKQIKSSVPHYTFVTIDSDPSPELVVSIDSLNEESLRDKTINPFHQNIVDYMRQHDSVEILKKLSRSISTINIDADEIGADHEFTSDESRQLLIKKILAE